MPKAKKELKVKVGKTLGIIGGDHYFTPYTLPDGTVYATDTISIATYRKMREDYQISACLNVLAFTIQKMDWYLIGEDEKVKDFCEKSIKKIWNQLVKVMVKSFWAGYSPATKVFEYDENLKGINYKEIRDLAPESCRVKIDKNGGFDGFKQFPGQSNQQDINYKYAFWFTNQMENGDLYGKSMLKAAYKPWYYSEIIHLFANRYYERFGEPAVVGRAPIADIVKDSNGNAVDAINSIKSAGEGLKSHSVLGIPSDRDENGNFLFDISYLESQMRGVDFDTYLKRLDMEKSRAVFVPDLLLGTGRVGSYELGKEHKATFITGLMGLFDDFGNSIEKYILPQLVEYNFGSSVQIPEFSYLPLTKTSEDSLVYIMQAYLNGNPGTLDALKLATKLGVPMKDAKEVLEIEEEMRVEKAKNNAKLNDSMPPIERKKKPMRKYKGDTVDKQFQRISKYVTSIIQSNDNFDKKIYNLSNTRIGFPELYDDNDLYLSLEKDIRDIAIRGLKENKSLDAILSDIHSLLILDK